MDLQNEIRDLTMSFFEAVGSDIVQKDGICHVAIPKKFQQYFRGEKISITFDRDAASRYGCELVMPGSRTLSAIMNVCSGRGPISIKESRGDSGQTAIRYHFFINFSGINNISQMMHVDVNLDAHKLENDPDVLEDRAFPPGEIIGASDITSSYALATDAIRAKSDELKTRFVSDATRKFREDFGLLADKYDTQIRELDCQINQKAESADSRDFRFDTLDRIKELESEKARLNEAMQKKHRLNLEYSLIACEIIRPDGMRQQ